MITVFLGAGFSILGGVPLASQLFARHPVVDRVTRQRLVERVIAGWTDWHARTNGTAEEYLAHLEVAGAGGQWRDATWYVSLVIALSLGTIRSISFTQQRTIIQTNLNRTSGIPAHEEFWTLLFRHTEDVAVVTTNYDVVAERGLRNTPRPRRHRPGFHYGFGPERLLGSGAPSFSHIRPIMAAGRIPLLKLHGSVSWSISNGVIGHYFDCRPAIQGRALIIAPVTEKSVPQYLQPIWDKAADALSRSQTWLVIGYSFPTYDKTVNVLLAKNAGHWPAVHVFNPDATVAKRVKALLPGSPVVVSHPGLPEGTSQLSSILSGDSSVPVCPAVRCASPGAPPSCAGQRRSQMSEPFAPYS